MKRVISFSLDADVIDKLPKQNRSEFVNECIKFGMRNIFELKQQYKEDQFKQLMNDPFRMNK